MRTSVGYASPSSAAEGARQPVGPQARSGMARNNGRDQKDRGKRKPIEVKGRVRRGRPKVCQFCADHVEWVDYKDTAVLRRFMNDRGRIKTRSATGTWAQHQRDVAVAVKTARELVLLPYVVRN